LETAAKERIVVVRYNGRGMDILTGCTVQGQYRYARVNTKTDAIEIKDQAALQAKIPLGFVDYRAKLEKAGQLSVNTIVVGQYANTPKSIPQFALAGECAEATHYVAVLSVGAFVFRTAADTEVGVAAQAWSAEAEAEWSQSKSSLNRDGRRSACSQSSDGDTRPPEDCSATIGVTLARFQWDTSPIACDDPEPPSSAQRTWGWVATGAGAAGAITFGITGALALSNRGSLDGSASCDSGTHHCTNKQSDVDSYNLTRNISMVALPVGVVGLGTGITLLLTAPSSRQTESAGVRPWFGVGSAGLEGSF